VETCRVARPWRAEIYAGARTITRAAGVAHARTAFARAVERNAALAKIARELAIPAHAMEARRVERVCFAAKIQQVASINTPIPITAARADEHVPPDLSVPERLLRHPNAAAMTIRIAMAGAQVFARQ
jgi:hypothetical protein